MSAFYLHLNSFWLISVPCEGDDPAYLLSASASVPLRHPSWGPTKDVSLVASARLTAFHEKPADLLCVCFRGSGGGRASMCSFDESKLLSDGR